jgi:hypothetical protein
MCNNDILLVLAFLLIELKCMKIRQLIHSHSVHQLQLIFPLICSMAFAACSDIAGTTGTHPNVNLLRADTPRVWSDSDQDFYQPPTDPQFNTARDQ